VEAGTLVGYLEWIQGSEDKVMLKSKTGNRNEDEGSPSDAKRQLDSFLDKYDPEIAAFARRALTKMRRLVPGAIEMVYDNYNWLVIGFAPSERPSEAIFSLVLPPGRVSLCFLQGAGLPDPAKRLEGKGKLVRNIRLYSLGKRDEHVLDDPEVAELMNLALNRAKVPMPGVSRRKLIIQSVSANQRPRRLLPGKKRDHAVRNKHRRSFRLCQATVLFRREHFRSPGY
jgi:hypothetical protein